MPTKGLMKEKARNLLNKWLTPDSLPPNPKTEIDLVQSLSTLALNDRPSSNARFVGGFNPGHLLSPVIISSESTSSFESSKRPASSNPPQMPAPRIPSNQHSLTMQMALLPANDSTTTSIPMFHISPPQLIPEQSTSSFRSFSRPLGRTEYTGSSISAPSLAPPHPRSASGFPSSAPSTPSIPRPTLKSGHSDPTSDKPTVIENLAQCQCAGITKAGKRCTRTVKNGAALSQYIVKDNGGDEPPLERFCFQHAKEVLGPSGYYARKNGEWLNFEDWIPSYLQQDTQILLRLEMEKPHSQRDVSGYIYTFEIRDLSEPDVVSLKVGRAVNLVRRIDQWGKQCGSKEQILRGFYPGSVTSNGDENDGSLMKGRVIVGEKSPWCHRLERLIHLELADLIATCVYLDSTWPHVSPEGNNLPNKSSRGKSAVRCIDCGSIHKEIFGFRRWEDGRNMGREWEVVVKPVIERWGRFVDLYV